MKKAKITLTAILAIGIAGGALAFKARHFSGTVTTWCKWNPSTNKCNLASGKKTYSNASLTGIVISATTVCTSDPNTPCTQDEDCQVSEYTIYKAL